MESLLNSPENKIKDASKILNETSDKFKKSVTKLNKVLSETRNLETKNNQLFNRIVFPEAESKIKKDTGLMGAPAAAPRPTEEQQRKSSQSTGASAAAGALTAAGAGALLTGSLSKEQDITSTVASSGDFSRGTFLAYSLYSQNRNGRPHKGLDISGPRGTYIALNVDSEILSVNNQPEGYGNYIDLWCPNPGVRLRFAHCDSIFYTSGKLPAGRSFATLGSTGNSGGPHIHFEYTKRKDKTTADGPPDAYIGFILLTKNRSSGLSSKQNTTTVNPNPNQRQPPSTLNRNSRSSILNNNSPTISPVFPTAQTPQIVPVAISMGGEDTSGANINSRNILSMVYQNLFG